MKEESQIEDMRAALRGDRERARARRTSVENVRTPVEPARAVAAPEPPRRRTLLDRLFGR